MINKPPAGFYDLREVAMQLQTDALAKRLRIRPDY